MNMSRYRDINMSRYIIGFLVVSSVIVLWYIFSGDNLIEEVKERYDDGKLKVVEYYKKVGDNQELVRKKEFYDNGQIEYEKNYKDGKQDGKYVSYHKNGQIKGEEN